MNGSKLFFLLIFFLLLSVLLSDVNIELFENINKRKELYGKLMGDFDKIFPDGNRNSGGAQFYHHIVRNLNPSVEEYKVYNQMYCSVSGSPIDYKDGNFDKIVVEGLNGGKYYGKYYRCCWPCLCDVMKYVKVENHVINLKGENYKHYVLTISDPCLNESEIPEEVSSFKCSNKNTDNAIHSTSGRVIIGILHDGERYNSEDISSVMDKCEERINADPNDLKNGMGDIFVKLSLVGNSF